MAALPLVLGTAGALFAVPAVNKAFTPDLRAPPDDESLEATNMANMNELGANASTWNVLVQKQFLMGTPVSDVDGINYTARATGYDPKDSQQNPLEHVNKQHQELYNFDRSDAQFNLWAQKGEIRPRRNQGISTPLSAELHHPNDPTRKTSFLATSYVPNYAHYAQIQIAKKVAASDDPERSLRRQEGVEYYYRAPFQSFRYSE